MLTEFCINIAEVQLHLTPIKLPNLITPNINRLEKIARQGHFMNTTRSYKLNKSIFNDRFEIINETCDKQDLKRYPERIYMCNSYNVRL